LFENGVPPGGLILVETRSTSTGVLINTYHPGGPVPKQEAPAEPPSKAELIRRKKLGSEFSSV
jgi:hypothetical protein